MCKVGDIVLVKKGFIGSSGTPCGTHSFIVIDNEGGQVKGLDYSIAATILSSFD